MSKPAVTSPVDAACGFRVAVMARRWTPTEDVAVRLAAALDWEHGGHRLVDLAERLGRTESAVRQRTSRLRALQLDEDVDAVDGPSVMR